VNLVFSTYSFIQELRDCSWKKFLKKVNIFFSKQAIEVFDMSVSFFDIIITVNEDEYFLPDVLL